MLGSVTARAKSIASANAIVRRVNGLIQYYIDTRNETAVALTGESSLALLRDFLESIAERGRTAPSAGSHAPSIWDEAIGVDWPLTNPLVASAATVETNEAEKRRLQWASKP